MGSRSNQLDLQKSDNLLDIYTPHELAQITYREIQWNRKKRQEEAKAFLIDAKTKIKNQRHLDHV